MAEASAQEPPGRPVGTLDIIRQAGHLLDRADRRRLAVVAALAVLNSALEAIAAFLILVLIQVVVDPQAEDSYGVSAIRDRFSDISDQTFVIGLAAGVALFYLVKNGLVVVQGVVQSREASRVSRNVAVRLLRGYLHSPYRLHLVRNVPGMTRTIVTGADTSLSVFVLSVIGLASEAMLLIGVAIVVLIAEPVIAPIAALVTGLALVGMQRAVQRWFDRLGRRSYELAERNLRDVQQGLGAFRELQVLGRADHMLRQYEEDRAALAAVTWRFNASTAAPRLVFESVFVVILSILVIALSYGSSTRLGPAPILGLFAYSGLRFLPAASRIMVHLSNVRHSSWAVTDIIGELAEVEAEALSAPKSASIDFETIELRSISYRYPGSRTDALRDVSFSFRRGETIGIVGSTGGGKSTLLDLLVGLLTPSTGQIVVNGADITGNMRGWQNTIGYVPQSPFLIDDTLRRNIALGVSDHEIDDAAVDEAVRAAQLGDLLPDLEMGMDEILGERGVRLSGGQRQRVAIARALYHRPDVLVFDEATSALDYETEREVTNAVARLARLKTVVIVAHRLSLVRTCDRVIFLDSGSVADIGTFDEIAERNPVFSAMVRAGIEGQSR